MESIAGFTNLGSDTTSDELVFEVFMNENMEERMLWDRPIYGCELSLVINCVQFSFCRMCGLGFIREYYMVRQKTLT